MSRYRVEKLEEVGFQWRINDNSYKQISWDERFEVSSFMSMVEHLLYASAFCCSVLLDRLAQIVSN